METSPDLLLEENFKHLDLVTQKAIHDQMILVCAAHCLTPQGNFQFHYHNVIFGLRKQKDLVDCLDFGELLAAVAWGSKIGFVF